MNHFWFVSKGLPPLMRSNSHARSLSPAFSSWPTTPPLAFGSSATFTATLAQALMSLTSSLLDAAARLK